MNRWIWIAAMTLGLASAGVAFEPGPSVLMRGVSAPRQRAAAAGAPFPAFMLAATEQVDRGRMLFLNNCAKCHGQQGQGGDGPRLIGTPNGLADYMTARGLYDFASTQMPNDNPGSLKAEEYWDVLAFLLDANRLLPSDTVLGPENADNIKLGP